MSLNIGMKYLVIAVASAGCALSWGAPADEKAYRAGVGLANKGANEAAVQELNRYLGAEAKGANAVSARYTLGVCLARLERYAEAAKALDSVVGVKDFAFVNDARLLRAQCASAMGDNAGAIASLKRLLKDSPQFEKADQAAMLYGESQYRLGRAEQARAALQGFSTKWPKSELIDRADLICAHAEISLAEIDNAAARLEGLLKRSPNGACAPNAALALGQCRQNRGDMDGARKMYEIAAKSGGVVAFDAELGVARLARAAGDNTGAEGALRSLENGTTTPDQKAQVAIERGKLLLQQGKAEEANTVFADLAKSGPAAINATARLWQAKCDLKAGRAEQAARRLAELADQSGESDLLPEILFDHAIATSQSGDDAGAAKAWKEWQQRFGAHALAAQANAALAACQYRLGQYGESLSSCRAILERNRDYPRASEIVLLLGENQFLLEQYADANRTFELFIERFANDPARARVEIRRGLCLEKMGRRDDAEKALASAVEGLAGDVDKGLRAGAMATLGDMCVSRQDWVGAEKWFGRAIESAGADASADLYLRFGVALSRQGNIGPAVAQLEKAWKAAAGTALENHAAFEYARVLAEAGRTDEATERLTAIVRAEKGAASPELMSAAYRQLAAIASGKGDAKGAAEALAQIESSPANASGGGASSGALLEQASAWLAAGEYLKAQQACDTFLETKPKGKSVTIARARRAIALNRQGKHEEAIREFTAIAGRSASLDRETLGAARYETALALRALGRDEEAGAAYRSLLEGEPSPSAEAYAALDLGQIALGQKNVDEAMGLLDRCQRVAAKLPEAEAARVREREIYLRALCFQASGKPADAAKALEDFEKSYPASELLPSVRLTLGDALGQCGRSRDAASVLTKVAADPATGANLPFALLRLGEVSADASLWDESEKAYSNFLATQSGDAMWFRARFGQGWALENQSKYDAACEAYRDVVDRHEGPTAARSQFQIGECLYAQKRHEDAIREFLKVDVLYGYPEWSAAALYEAGRCMRELGREKDAAAQFEEVVKRFPDTRWAALAKEVPAVSAAGLPGSKTEMHAGQ
ncbi:MAG: tetratricopeptide repeat protein [Phycisphaeraceae bacterium]|nr:tetratricopeptide repeat protein [Phycisphaeraceae bacterium]